MASLKNDSKGHWGFQWPETASRGDIVFGNDGWEAAAADIVGISDFDADPEKIWTRYSVRTLTNTSAMKRGLRLDEASE